MARFPWVTYTRYNVTTFINNTLLCIKQQFLHLVNTGLLRKLRPVFKGDGHVLVMATVNKDTDCNKIGVVDQLHMSLILQRHKHIFNF